MIVQARRQRDQRVGGRLRSPSSHLVIADDVAQHALAGGFTVDQSLSKPAVAIRPTQLAQHARAAALER
jgi:hypothetical protein